MPRITNKSPGPRVINVRGGQGNAMSQVTLQPGQSADLDVADMDGPVMRHWIERKEIEVDARAAEAPKQALTTNPSDPAGADAVHRAAMDAERRTPPKMFGGDGGPEQAPTVDGRDGAPTPRQKEGAPDPKADEQAEEDRRKALEKAEQQAAKEAAKEGQQAPASRSQPAPANDPRGSRGRG